MSLEASLDFAHKGVAEVNHRGRAAVVFRHFMAHSIALGKHILHEATVGAAESVNVLIVVSHGNHAKRFVVLNERIDKRGFGGVHVLRFVNHEHRFADARGLGIARSDLFGGFENDAVGFLQ